MSTHRPSGLERASTWALAIIIVLLLVSIVFSGIGQQPSHAHLVAEDGERS